MILFLLAFLTPPASTSDVLVISNSNGQPSPISSTPAWPGGPQVFTSDSSGVTLTISLSNPLTLEAYCVLDGRAVINGTCTKNSAHCSCSLGALQGAGAGLHSATLYTLNVSTFTVSLVGDPVFFRLAADGRSPTHTAADAALRALTPPGSGRLGTYTTPYITVAAQIYQNITRLFNRTVSLEDVVRGGGFLNSSVWAYQSAAASPAWASHPSQVYQDTPALGMYCLWRKRGNETNSSLLPDCPEADTVLRTHASLMAAVGIEWVAPDATNSDGDPRGKFGRAGPDLSILRPLEVMGEVWEGMRAGGEATPQLSVFAKVGGGPLWRWLLDALYNNETLLAADLVLMSSSSSSTTNGGSGAVRSSTSTSPRKKVFFAAAEPGWNATVVSLIEDNGGRGDVVAPLMWLSPNASAGWEEGGFLTYVSPCVVVTAGGNGGTPRYSTEEPFVAPGTLTTPCGHRPTLHPPPGMGEGGAFWTVSAAVPTGSAPLSGHRYGGLYLKKQWWDVMAAAAAAAAALPSTSTPIDYIFVPSFNEWIAGASPISEPNLLFTTPGALPSDSAKYSQFTDAFLQGHSRTIEPGVAREGEGGRAYLTLASCTRVHRLQSALNGWGKWRRVPPPSSPPCAVLGEECCTVRPDETLTLVYSLSSPGWVGGGSSSSSSNSSGGVAVVVVDSIATGNASLVAEKVGGEKWKEVCNPMFNPLNGGTTLACADKSMLWRVPKSPPSPLDPAFDVVRGPFLVFSPPPPGEPSTPPVEGARVLVRCVVGGGGGRGGQHFLAVAPSAQPATTSLACGQVVEGGGVEEAVGWVAGVRVGGWASALTRCFAQGQGGFWYHTERMGPMGGCAEGDEVQEVLGFVI